jgi:hypothetical protein
MKGQPLRLVQHGAGEIVFEFEHVAWLAAWIGGEVRCHSGFLLRRGRSDAGCSAIVGAQATTMISSVAGSGHVDGRAMAWTEVPLHVTTS